jgi:hypothetical protein
MSLGEREVASEAIELCTRRTRTTSETEGRSHDNGQPSARRRDKTRYERNSARYARLTTPPSAGAAQRAPIEINVASLKARYIAVVSSAWVFYAMGGMELPPSSRPVKLVEKRDRRYCYSYPVWVQARASMGLKNDCPNHDDRASLKNK